MTIAFSKYHGTGNDFILIDNRDGHYDHLDHHQIKKLCHRHFGIGADGLMLLNTHAGYDFEMKYWNADGHPSTMCGNGGRCLVKFAHACGIHKLEYHFLAIDGPHEAEIKDNGHVSLKMKDVTHVEEHSSYSILDTGSPHFVKFASDIMDIDVVTTGSEIRYSSAFKEHGINVNFVETLSEDHIFVRTYERGVEDETLSCGTGVTAAALLSAHNERGFNEVRVKTLGGQLSVEFDRIADAHFTNIRLVGAATFVYSGQMTLPD
jgi:diaminopimelate epimerase